MITIIMVLYAVGTVIAFGVFNNIEHSQVNQLFPITVVLWPICIVFIPLYLFGAHIGKLIDKRIRDAYIRNASRE